MDNNDVTFLLDPDSLVETTVSDRYRLTRLVSEGSSTLLYDAADDQTGRVVHLKLIRPHLTGSPKFRERFEERMRAASALSHPNIAAIYDWGMAAVDDAFVAFVVVEHLTGGSLRDLLDRGRRLSPSQALGVGLDACKALDYAHRRGQIHAEINPSKLVFGDDRRLRIVDFGLAGLLGEYLWVQPDQVPTHQAWYAAPEQGVTREVTDKIDVYSLCLSLNEAVTGELPFKSDSTINTLANRVGRLLPVSADLGPLAAVFEKAGRPEADERSTASEFGRDLVRAASKLPRPEPLPLLSTGLFDVPAEQLRSPDDPTGGVNRPPGGGQPATEPLVIVSSDPDPESDPDDAPDDAPAEVDGADPTTRIERPDDPVIAAPRAPVPDPPEIVEAAPERRVPKVDADDDLVILPLDTTIPAAHRPSNTTPAASDVPPVVQPQLAAATQPLPTHRDPEPESRRKWVGVVLRTILGLVVIAALVAIGFAASRLFTTTTHTVPNLTGLNEAEALNLVSTNNWIVSVDSERSDEVPEVDAVVRTSPAAGAELAEDEPFLIVISEGPVLRELPEVTGLTLAEAQTALVDLNLQPSAVDEFDEVIPVGDIIRWSVPGEPTLGAGSLVEPATPVELIVSRGPAPRVVPNLVETGVEAARQATEALQLEFNVSAEEFSDDIPAGVVISQDIAPDTEVERGSAVSVVVSKGVDLVAFPDLSTAANYNEAQQILADAGFVARLVFGDTEGTDFEYTIDDEVPEVGDEFRRGTEVDFQAL